MDTYKQAKQGTDLRQILKSKGYTLQADKVLAPWRDERTASVHIYADRWHDFGSNDRGDLLDWLEREPGATPDTAREEASSILGIPSPGSLSEAGGVGTRVPPKTVFHNKTYETPATPTDWIGDFVNQAHAALMTGESAEAARARQYLEGRKLEGLTTALRFGVVDDSVSLPEHFTDGYKRAMRGRLVIPYLLKGEAVYYNSRDLTGQAEDRFKYLKPKGLSAAEPFNAEGLEDGKGLGWALYLESELDAAAVLQAFGTGYPAIGCSGGKLPDTWHEKIAAAGIPAYILFDSDQPGRKKAEDLRAKLTSLGAEAYIINLTTGHKDANEVLQELGPDKLREIINTGLEEVTLEKTSDLLYIRDTWLDELDARANRPHAAYTTGVEALDKLLGGGYVEGLHLLGGITGGGKTSKALSVALHNALEGRSVIYASYEQSRLELWARIASRLTRVPYGAIKRGVYDHGGRKTLVSEELRESEGWPQLEQVAKNLKIVEGGDHFSRSDSTYTVDVLTTTAQDVAEERGTPPLIIIDYLQRVPVPAALNIKDPRERVSFIAGQLQVKLARGVSCPVLALSSIGRASYRQLAEADIEGRLSAYKEAGELEYTAYTALLVYGLPEEVESRLQYSPGMLGRHKSMTIDLVKNREGQIGRLAAKWKPQLDTWYDAVPYPEGRR
jgi:replicative DNA helicase